MKESLGPIIDSLTADGVRRRYVKLSIYLPSAYAYHLRRAALDEGFRLGDLVRIVFMVGLAVRLLNLDPTKSLSGTRSNEAIRHLNSMLGQMKRASKRPYPVFRGSRGSWVTTSLPAYLLSILGQYADIRGESRNNMLEPYIRDGLLAFTTVRAKILEAVVEAQS